MWWKIRARKRPSWREGPFSYYQNWSATIDRDGARGGMTSHGFRIALGLLGKLTHRLGSHSILWDYPGPGSMEIGHDDQPPPPPRQRRRRTR